MKIVLNVNKNIIDDQVIGKLNSFILARPNDDIYIIANGEFEEACSELRSGLFGIIAENKIKVWNWYPDNIIDMTSFMNWFIGQFCSDEVWEFSEEGIIKSDYNAENEQVPKLTDIGESYLRSASKSVADSTLFNTVRRVYIDLSDAVAIDFTTGIQRVCYALIENIKDLLKNKEMYEVYPVYSEPSHNITIKCDYKNGRYVKQDTYDGNVVQFCDGDYLLMPDINIMNVSTKVHYYRRLHNRGVKVITLLHDIIPIRFAEYYSNDHVQVFTEYAKAISNFSGIIANSKATMDDYSAWLQQQEIELKRDFIFDYFRLGCDLDRANPSPLRSNESLDVINTFMSKHTFLMVATIEPRKMHEQVLKAFELLWEKGHDLNLVFVGKYGWQMEQFAAYMNSHHENGKHLFWMEGISDSYLEAIYNASTAVISASVTEGFGLPIIEASYYGKYLILRDIPVFREVAGEGAYYFDTMDANGLATNIEQWEQLFINGEVPSSSSVKMVNWKESALEFINKAGITIN